MKRVICWGMDLLGAYNRCNVPQSAAALAYFLILTLFPLLMCVNYFIGLFHWNLEQMILSVGQVFPQAVLGVVIDYLTYASQHRSPAVFAAALSAIVLSASAGLRALLGSMDRLYDRTPKLGFGRLFLSVALSLLFLLTIYLSVVVIFTGQWFFSLLDAHLPAELAALLPLRALSSLWGWLKYLLLFCFVLLLVLMVYWAGTPRERTGWGTILSAALSAGIMVAFSVLFAWFISLSTRYSLLYGSLASLIILLVWLYLCGNILLLGATVSSLMAQNRR